MHILDIPRSLPAKCLQKQDRGDAQPARANVAWRLSPEALRFNMAGNRIRRRPITQHCMSAKLTYEVMHASFADNGITSELEGL